jgi:alpha-ketoglutarate-dependent taurine dioxygenase
MVEMLDDIQTNGPWGLSSDRAYLDWRGKKLSRMSSAHYPNFVDIRRLDQPTHLECADLVRQCENFNLVLYRTSEKTSDPCGIRENLRRLANHLGLIIAERHRSADQSGVVALTVSQKESQRGYIPYSRKAMNWHTDGYYNSPDNPIRSMILHCVQPADEGGINQFLDPEIAYIRLRDENPDFIAALMHPRAMVIPENREADGSLRPVSIGPVFSVNPTNNKLTMRYTARTRSIAWRDDLTTKKAATFLQDFLEAGDPHTRTVKLKTGQGVLCNNVLHNRTGFTKNSGDTAGRLMFRVRFHNRVEGS